MFDIFKTIALGSLFTIFLSDLDREGQVSNVPRKRRFYKKNIKGNFDWFDLYLVLTRQFITSNDDQVNGLKCL